MGSLIFHPLPEEKVFNDSVHGYIHVHDLLIWRLINTPEFQRLRRISQLGGARMVFSSAEHSRFSHGLGAYELARLILENVVEVKAHLTELEQMTVLCAALLHDIGHGPFSHAFEQIHPVAHEYYSSLIVTHPSTKIFELLSSTHPDLPELTSNAIQSKHSNTIVNQLISSPLDVDRLDYLLRDAYHTGTPYGKLDLERLFRVMVVQENRIVFKASGVPALENYFMGRSHMYQSVYYHPVSVSFETMLGKVFQRMKDLHHQGYRFKTIPTLLIPFFGSTPVQVHDHQRADDHVIGYYLNMMQYEKDTILSDLAARLQNRQLFDVKSLVMDDDRQAIKTYLSSMNYNLDYYYSEIASQVKNYDKSAPLAIMVKSTDALNELSTVSDVVRTLTLNQKPSIVMVFPKSHG